MGVKWYDGKVLWADKAGGGTTVAFEDDCCCCDCPDADYWGGTLTLTGVASCPLCEPPYDPEPPASPFISSYSIGGTDCVYTGYDQCLNTADTRARVELLVHPTYGCVWWLTVVFDEDDDLIFETDIFTGYRAFDPGAPATQYGCIGAYTKVSGCADGASIA
jgi:hypothetical protein